MWRLSRICRHTPELCQWVRINGLVVWISLIACLHLDGLYLYWLLEGEGRGRGPFACRGHSLAQQRIHSYHSLLLSTHHISSPTRLGEQLCPVLAPG